MMRGVNVQRFLSAAWRTAPSTQRSSLLFSTTSGASSSAAAAALLSDQATVSAAHKRIVNKIERLFNKSGVFGLEDVEMEIQSTVEFLQDRLMCSKTRAIQTIALHPMLITYNKATMDAKLEWLEKNGIPRRSAARAIQRHPCMIGRSEASLQARFDWFLDQGVEPDRLAFIVSVFPQVMSASMDTLDSKLDALRTIGMTDEAIVRLLQRFPQALTMSIDVFREKSKWAMDWGLTQEEMVRLLGSVPEFLSLNLEKVGEKLALLDELFGEGAARRLWSKNFRIVMVNSDQLRRSFVYLTTVVGVPVNDVRLTMLMRRVDRMLQPRFEFLCELTSVDPHASYDWVLMPETEFVDRHPEFEEFKALRAY